MDNNYVGSITKLSGKRKKIWWARTPPIEIEPGIKDRVSLGIYRTKREAQAVLSNWEAVYKQKMAKIYTLKQVYEFAIDELRGIGKTSEKTLDSYLYDFKRVENLWDMDIRKISTSNYQNVFNSMKNKTTGDPLSAASKTRTKNILSIIYWYALKEDIVSFDSAAGIIVYSEMEKSDILAFSEMELKILWQNLYKVPYVDMILFDCYTGLRPSELMKCNTTNVNVFARSITDVGVKTRKGRQRVVPLPSKIIPLTQKLIENALPNGVIFYTPNYVKMTVDNFLKRYFPRALEQCGIDAKKFVPYSCRHTYAEMLERNFIDRKLQSDLLGHEKISTTKIYQTPQLEVLLSAVESL